LNGAERNFVAASDGTNILVAGGYNPAIVPMRAAQIYRNSAR